MLQTITRSVLFPVLLTAAVGTAQIPGVTATLRAEHDIVSADADIAVVLTIDVQKTAEVPNELLGGVMLDVKVDDKPGPQVREGKSGTTTVAGGTKIERRIAVPVDKAMADKGGRNVLHLSLTWPNLPGANCVLQVAPDRSKYTVEELDLAKTKVVLSTSMGDMTVAFHPEKAPKTVANFVKLSRDGFYDGTKFHRVIRDFMIQGGDPNSKDDSKQDMWGQGGSGTNLEAEFNDLRHVRGVLSMARSNDPNSASSQFFIVHRDTLRLDHQYTAFGALEKGADVLDAIANTRCGAQDRPLTPVILQRAVVLPAYK